MRDVRGFGSTLSMPQDLKEESSSADPKAVTPMIGVSRHRLFSRIFRVAPSPLRRGILTSMKIRSK